MSTNAASCSIRTTPNTTTTTTIIHRPAVMPAPTRKVRIEQPDDLSLEVIQKSLALIPPIFSQAQQSLASHKKNVVAIRKIQVQCSKLIEEHPNGKSIKLVGEKAFNAMFIDMVGRVL